MMKEIKKKGKLLIALLLSFALITALASCGSGSSSQDSSADQSDDSASESEELSVLRIGVGGGESTLLLEGAILAYVNGYFEEELNEAGYTIEFYAFSGGGTEVNEALAAGELDGAIYGDFPAFTSKSSGIETTIIAAVNQRMQYSFITASDEISSGEDFEGHTVVFTQGTVQQYFWDKYVEASGINEDEIEVVYSSDYASLLATGSADFAAVNTYVAYYLEDLDVGTVLDAGDEYDIYTTFVVTLLDSFLEENPDVAVALIKALIRSYEAAAEDPESMYAALETDSMSAEVMATSYAFDESLWYLTPEILDETVEYYEELNVWLYENGITQSEIDIDSFIDMQYYYQAAEELEAQ